MALPGSGAGDPPVAALEPVYRWDSRRPAVVFDAGFRPTSGTAPVRFTRKPEPETETGTETEPVLRRTRREAGTGNVYRYTAPNAQGGVDVAMSLGTVTYVHRREVVFWKGMAPEHIARVDVFDRNDELFAALDNPRCSAEARQAQAWLDRRTAGERVWAATCGVEVDEVSEYDRYCHRYAEWHLRSAQHSERGRIDGHVRTYAEFWRENCRQPEIRQYAEHWVNELGVPWSQAFPPQPPGTTEALYKDYALLARTTQGNQGTHGAQGDQGPQGAQPPLAGAARR
ncbi:hypothetical protein ACFVTT_10250 [Streptomyces niveus]|uniref:scabin-related ADP-ribosyltransferase n=1 Tax=Streptomyces niveus TaxID=193462 RepID=UPI003651EB8C